MSSRPNSSTELQEDPGAYPILCTLGDAELGSRLDSLPPSLRYWAVSPERASARWYNDMVEANNKYEDWLNTRPPGEYPVPFKSAEGKRLDEIGDGLRNWAVHHDRSSASWYAFFKRANDRYEENLARTRKPGDFPFPQGNNNNYIGVPIKNIPQDIVWWALRPSNGYKGWYDALYDANKRMLDDIYKSRSPGSESFWFGKYRGHRLDQVCERRGYIYWCFSQMQECGKLYRLKDLVERLDVWRLAHPERSAPRRRRKRPDIQNPVGEAIGPWDDSLGSADEDEYDRDGFIQSDSEDLQYETESDDEAMEVDGEDDEVNDANKSDKGAKDSENSEGPTSSSVETRPSARRFRKRRRTNAMILSDSSELEESTPSTRKLGKRYRVACEDSDE